MGTKKFRSNGYNAPITTFMRNYKVGDVVDVVCDSRQQKGMPHKYYHGRTGRIWNVTKRAVGVEINKVHRQRQIVKRIHVRMEHLRPSKSAAGHLARIKSNEAIKKAAKLSGVPALASVLVQIALESACAFRSPATHRAAVVCSCRRAVPCASVGEGLPLSCPESG